MDLDPDRHLDRSTEHRGRGACRRLGTWQGVGQFTSNQLLQNGTSVLLDRALGGKGSLGDALQNSLANAFAAYGFKLIGDTTHGVLDDGSLGKIGLHALMGGLAAEAVGGDFRTGALAAGVNEALVDSLAKQYASLPIDDKKGLLTMSSQLIGMLAASTQGDADAKSLQTGPGWRGMPPNTTTSVIGRRRRSGRRSMAARTNSSAKPE